MSGFNPDALYHYQEARALRARIAELEAQIRAHPEPVGLGAVVEDAHGHRFVRVDLPDTDYHWRSREAWLRWSEITAVRVLSEGVTP